MSKLVIVESPGKIKKISQILGPDWTVKASFGHVNDLPKDSYGISDDYKPTYVLSERGAATVKDLKFAVSKASEVYLATDPDREGEAISYHLQQVLRVPNAKRITFASITEAAIKTAISQVRPLDVNLVRAQETRRALDRIVGWKVSGPLSDAAGMNLSAGRVQSPAIRLVVDREREIRAFKPTDHFSAEATFDGGAWSAKLDVKALLKSKGDTGDYLLDRQIAELASSARSFRVVSSTSEPARKAPPAPFTTSTLLQAAGTALKLNPDVTMAAAQKLYEGGHITYHRTDYPNLSDEGAAGAKEIAVSRGLPLPSSVRKFRVAAGAQEAHEAIRPTHWEIEEAGDTDTERGLYKLIWLRAVASQLADAELMNTKLDLETDAGGQTFKFHASGSVTTAPGWKSLTAQVAEEDDDEKGEDDNSGKVPQLDTGSVKEAESGRLIAATTRPPNRYKLASLVKKVENLGIGRPSTYASLTSLIVQRGYVIEQKDRCIVPSPAGEAIVDGLANRFRFIDFDFTKSLEDQLDDIANGKGNYFSVVSTFDRQLSGELGTVAGPKYPCPKCGKGLKRYLSQKRGGHFGPASGNVKPSLKTITVRLVPSSSGTLRLRKIRLPMRNGWLRKMAPPFPPTH